MPLNGATHRHVHEVGLLQMSSWWWPLRHTWWPHSDLQLPGGGCSNRASPSDAVLDRTGQWNCSHCLLPATHRSLFVGSLQPQTFYYRITEPLNLLGWKGPTRMKSNSLPCTEPSWYFSEAEEQTVLMEWGVSNHFSQAFCESSLAWLFKYWRNSNKSQFLNQVFISKLVASSRFAPPHSELISPLPPPLHSASFWTEGKPGCADWWWQWHALGWHTNLCKGWDVLCRTLECSCGFNLRGLIASLHNRILIAWLVSQYLP